MRIGNPIGDRATANGFHIHINDEPLFEHVFICLLNLVLYSLFSQRRCINQGQILIGNCFDFYALACSLTNRGVFDVRLGKYHQNPLKIGIITPLDGALMGLDVVCRPHGLFRCKMKRSALFALAVLIHCRFKR